MMDYKNCRIKQSCVLKSQPLELCPIEYGTLGIAQGASGLGENVVHRTKLLLSHRSSLKMISLEISHHKSMNISKEYAFRASAGLQSR